MSFEKEQNEKKKLFKEIYVYIPNSTTEPSCILSDFLYVGSSNDAQNLKWLKDNSITGILCCAKELNYDELYDKTMNYLKMDITDIEEFPIEDFFEKAIDFLEKNKRVLVHCVLGMSRSPTIVIAYLIAKKKMLLIDALLYMKKIRDIVYPNDGFLKALIIFEKTLFGKNSLSLDDIYYSL
jgi:hypothetical protein